MNLNKEEKIKIVKIILILCFGLLSFFYLGKIFSDPNTYASLIEILDNKKANVMGLTASTSAASIAISALPNDLGTPIADQLANLSTYLLAILTVVYLEKYLLTIIGFVTFKVIIPIVCILYIVYILLPHNLSLRKVALKLFCFGLALFLLIPCSVTISNMIDATYESSINETIDNTQEEIEVNNDSNDTSSKDDLKWYEKIYNYFSETVEEVKNNISTSTSETIDKVKNILSNFIEATAVMIVTSCIIPVLTVLVFIWLTKIILGIEINKPEFLKIENKDKLNG